MSKRGTREDERARWIKRHLVTREIKRDNTGSRTVMKKPDPMEVNVVRIPRDG